MIVRAIVLAILSAVAQAACAGPVRGVEDGREETARRLIADLDAGRYAEVLARFDETMKGVLGEEKLAAVWKGLVAQVGALREQGAARVEPAGGYEAVFVTCRFEHASLEAKVVFDAQGRVAGLFFAPARPAPEEDRAKPPPGVREEEVPVGAGEWTLPGTLALPSAAPPFRAVVLVHGSGPHDRDETIGANKPFRDLAWGLAARGAAVLRYEKRTRHHAERMAAAVERITVREETIDDALAAVSMLRTRPEIDPARVFVLGHSLGGTLAPRIAEADGRLAGIVILAGAARPLEDLVVEQVRYLGAGATTRSRSTTSRPGGQDSGRGPTSRSASSPASTTCSRRERAGPARRSTRSRATSTRR
jgi:hypothetical protein